jgi:hypothetical protein
MVFYYHYESYKKTNKSKKIKLRETILKIDEIKCPYRGEIIKKKAKLFRFCGKSL